MGAGSLLIILWLQIVEGWPSGLRLVTYGQRLPDRDLVFVAWRHELGAWQTADFLARLLYDPDYPSSRALRLRRWVDSLGFSYKTWVGPQGIACVLETMPRYRLEAMRWLYAMLTTVEVGDGHWYEWGVHQWRRHHVGFQFTKQALYLLRGWPPRPPDYSLVLQYLETYLRPESLYIGCWGRLSLRDKAEWRRQWSLWQGFSFQARSTSVLPKVPPSVIRDTVFENEWAYPAYGIFALKLPSAWAERLALVAAWESRLAEAGPPLAYKAEFVGAYYQVEARLDLRSYTGLRQLDRLVPRTLEEERAWQAAYQLRRAKVLAWPAQSLDFWMGALLEADTLSLPEVWPDSLWRAGWSVRLQGVWIVPPEWGVDTLLEATTPKVRFVLDSAWRANKPFEAWWQPTRKGDSPPLWEWATAMQLALRQDSARCWLLVGYYRTKKSQAATLRALHQLRRILISQYQIRPSALQVQALPLPPDFHPKAIRLVCVGS